MRRVTAVLSEDVTLRRDSSREPASTALTACRAFALLCLVTLVACSDPTGNQRAKTLVALSLAKAGAGTGTVRSIPTGIECGSVCSAWFDSATVVTLTAQPADGSIFTGWSGAGCSGVGNCELKLTSSAHVAATFGAMVGTTGITDIVTLLELCPVADPEYARFRAAFEILRDGQSIVDPSSCGGPYPATPISDLTDELISLQVMRTAFHMSPGTAGRFPWTPLPLFEWLTTRVAGVNIRQLADGRAGQCCDIINGKRYFAFAPQPAPNREFRRSWPGVAGILGLFAHEVRHADTVETSHTNGCQAAADPTMLACDATYDVANLGAYGVQYWLEAAFAGATLNVGIGCQPIAVAQALIQHHVNTANGLRARFVTNPPPIVTASAPPGGPCRK